MVQIYNKNARKDVIRNRYNLSSTILNTQEGYLLTAYLDPIEKYIETLKGTKVSLGKKSKDSKKDSRKLCFPILQSQPYHYRILFKPCAPAKKPPLSGLSGAKIHISPSNRDKQSLSFFEKIVKPFKNKLCKS
jgi:hypothetical protein